MFLNAATDRATQLAAQQIPVGRYAAGTPVYAGVDSVHVSQLTDRLIVDFSRNPDSFAVNQYCKIVPVPKINDYFLRFGASGGLPEEGARIVNTTGDQFTWHDGNDAPSGKEWNELFALVEYKCKRRAIAYRVGDLMEKNADWDVLEQWAMKASQQMMTLRTQLAVTQLTTAGNYPTGNTSAVSSITGVTGKWDVSTVARSDIQRSIEHGIESIQKATTLGNLRAGSFKLVMSPGCARKIGVTQEIKDMIKQAPSGLDYIKGQMDPVIYGVPRRLYGVDVIIEDCVKVTNEKAATRASSFVLSDATPFLCYMEDADVNAAQAPNLSTGTIFVLEDNEMRVESFHLDIDKLTYGRVIDMIDPQVTAGGTGFLFTAAVD